MPGSSFATAAICLALATQSSKFENITLLKVNIQDVPCFNEVLCLEIPSDKSALGSLCLAYQARKSCLLCRDGPLVARFPASSPKLADIEMMAAMVPLHRHSATILLLVSQNGLVWKVLGPMVCHHSRPQSIHELYIDFIDFISIVYPSWYTSIIYPSYIHCMTVSILSFSTSTSLCAHVPAPAPWPEWAPSRIARRTVAGNCHEQESSSQMGQSLGV